MGEDRNDKDKQASQSWYGDALITAATGIAFMLVGPSLIVLNKEIMGYVTTYTHRPSTPPRSHSLTHTPTPTAHSSIPRHDPRHDNA